jgi:hypothetical protein
LVLYTETTTTNGTEARTTLNLATIDSLFYLQRPLWQANKPLPILSDDWHHQPLANSHQPVPLATTTDSRGHSTKNCVKSTEPSTTDDSSLFFYDGGAARFSPDCSTVVFAAVGVEDRIEEESGGSNYIIIHKNEHPADVFKCYVRH